MSYPSDASGRAGMSAADEPEPGGRPRVDPSIDGPLDRPTALALLDRADDLLDAGELDDALRHYQRVVGYDEPSITAAALLGIGTVYYRADHEDEAVESWKAVLALPETPGTYLALRQLAAAYVRHGRLVDALEAYRQADRRAPAQDRAEIAARLGWLTKETGDAGGARRYFARSRGADRAPLLTYGLIAVTSVVSVLAFLPDWSFLFDAFQLDKVAVAHGEYWRLLTSTLLHGGWLHLLFNMYALYFGGALVERIYGGRLMLLMYVVTGIAASTASFVFGSDVPSIGASGAIFGMFGVLVATARAHNPIVDRRSQAILGQIGVLIVINLVIGFVVPGIDYFAHIGGLVAGLWLGLVIVPGRVPTLSSLWQRPAGATDQGFGPGALQVLGVMALVAVIVAGLMIGTEARRGVGGAGSSTTAGETVAALTAATGARS